MSSVAPEIFVVVPDRVLFHWNVRAGLGTGLQTPGVAVSVTPTLGVPAIVGVGALKKPSTTALDFALVRTTVS